MLDDAAFLQAILDSPDDDAPRLIYADWLEEHGRGPRAELIRVQVRLARGPADREPLEAREKELLAAHRDEWLAELPAFEGIDWVSFGRGFVESARFVTSDAFVTHAEAVFASAPIQEAYFRKLLPEALEKMTQSPLFGRLRSFVAGHQGLANLGVLALVGMPTLSGLLELLIPGNRIGDPGAVALATASHLQRLKNLELHDNLLTDDGIMALAESPNLNHLERLHLVNNRFGDAGLIALAESRHLGNLKQLYLSHNRITSAGVVRLASSPLLAGLVALDFRSNSIDADGAMALAASPLAENIAELLITGNPLNNASVEALKARFGSRVRA